MKIAYRIENGFEEVLFVTDIPAGYTDITSVSNFLKWGDFESKDYKWIRKRFQELDFNSLSDNDKMLVAQKRGTTLENCKTVLGDAYEYWMTDFDVQSIACRKFRFAYAKTILIKNVSTADLYTILAVLGSMPLLYIEQGVEGTNDGNPISGLFNFIEANGDYTINGLLAMNLTMTNSVTKEEMVIVMMKCLRDGEY